MKTNAVQNAKLSPRTFLKDTLNGLHGPNDPLGVARNPRPVKSRKQGGEPYDGVLERLLQGNN